MSVQKMISVLTLAAISLFINDLTAQTYDCGYLAAVPYTVTAESGLILRAAPTTKGERRMLIPLEAEVTVCEESIAENLTETIQGKSGKWVKAYYKNKEGYLFDGFLRRGEPVDLIMSDYWVGNEINVRPDATYYALYAQNTDENNRLFNLELANSEPLLLTYEEEAPVAMQKLSFDQTPLLIISGINPNQTTDLQGNYVKNKFLFPGETLPVATQRGKYVIYAKGMPVEAKSGEVLTAFRGLFNYEIRIRRELDGKVEDQLLLRRNIEQWSGAPGEFSLSINWVGDLDGDGELDLIITDGSDSSYTWETLLFLSSKAEKGHFVKQVAQFFEEGC